MNKLWSAILLLVAAGLSAASCSVDPETAKQRYTADGDRYMAQKQYAQAVLQYRNAVRQDARFGEGRLKLAEAYLAAGDGRNALSESVRAADLMPDHMEAQLRAGSLLLSAGEYPEARARALAALDREPRNARALVLLGNAFAGLKDLDKAIEHVEQAIDEDPQLTLSYTNLGALHLAKGDREAAETALKRAIEAAPKSVFARLSLANFMWAVGRQDDAERELKVALQIEPRSPAVNRALAALYVGQRKASQAEPFLKTYVEESRTTEAKLVLSDYYVRSGRLPEATSVLASLIQEEDGFVPATLRLAALDLGAGRRLEAYQKLDEILVRRPKDEPALEAKVRFLLAEQRADEALTIANSLVDANPTSLRGRYVRGLALEATGSLDEAVKALQDVLAGVPSSVPVQAKLAALYLKQRNFKNALALAQLVVKAQPRSGDAHFLYAQTLLKSGDLTNAERELLALAKAAPSSAAVHVGLGMVYEARRDVRGARRAFERALELDPRSADALAGLVSADLAESRPAAARARIESRLAEGPADPRLVMTSALAYAAMRDLPKAEAAYRKLLELDANNIDAYSGLGTIYVSQNRLDEARRTFEQMGERQTSPVVAETMLGIIRLRQELPAEARRHFERALQHNPRAAVAANNLAWDYANNGGNLDVALQLAQTAKAELQDNASVTDTLGWIYYKKGLTGLAVTTLREAVQHGPSNPTIRYHLGLAYLQNGNNAEARAALEHVLKLSPQYPAADDVRQLLATIE